MTSPFVSSCELFVGARGRDAVAEAARGLVDSLQVALKEGLRQEEAVEEICVAVLSVLEKCRVESVEQTLTRVKEFMKCDSLSLLDVEQWDPLCMLLFVCECQCRALLLDNASVARRVFGADNAERIALDAEASRGVRILKPSEYLSEDGLVERYGMSLCVCFDKGTLFGDDGAFAQKSCITRKGIRLLERYCLRENLESALCSAVDALPDKEILRNEENEERVRSWVHKNITVDSNNTLLLRLDEWALCCMLTPGDSARASGERGGVPQEHRNTPAAWVAREAREDAEYRRMMLESKKNEAHPQNAYVCFSALLEQNYNFDFMERCFVSRLNPQMALKKFRTYMACAHAKTPPLIVETRKGVRVAWRGGAARVESPFEALCAWMHVVKTETGGLFTRKADVSSVWDRLRQSREDAEEKEKTMPSERISLPNL